MIDVVFTKTKNSKLKCFYKCFVLRFYYFTALKTKEDLIVLYLELFTWVTSFAPSSFHSQCVITCILICILLCDCCLRWHKVHIGRVFYICQCLALLYCHFYNLHPIFFMPQWGIYLELSHFFDPSTLSTIDSSYFKLTECRWSTCNIPTSSCPGHNRHRPTLVHWETWQMLHLSE